MSGTPRALPTVPATPLWYDGRPKTVDNPPVLAAGELNRFVSFHTVSGVGVDGVVDIVREAGLDVLVGRDVPGVGHVDVGQVAVHLVVAVVEPARDVLAVRLGQVHRHLPGGRLAGPYGLGEPVDAGVGLGLDGDPVTARAGRQQPDSVVVVHRAHRDPGQAGHFADRVTVHGSTVQPHATWGSSALSAPAPRRVHGGPARYPAQAGGAAAVEPGGLPSAVLAGPGPGHAEEVASTSSARWQAAIRPGPTGRSSGTSVRHRSTASGQRGWNTQPGGGLVASG